MELRTLRYVIELADQRHFGRAAERLGIRQPTLSRQIRVVEDELGVVLFDRDSRHVEPTAACLAFLDPARRAVASADEAVDRARLAARGETGRLAVGFVGSAGTHLPGWLRTFSRRYPAVDLDLQEMPTAHQVAALEAGTLDIGFVRPPLPVADGVLDTVDVLRESLMVAVPVGHRLARTPSVPVAGLAGERFVLFPRSAGPGLYDQVMAVCRDAGFEPEIAQHATEMRTLLGLVSGGFGLALVPSSAQGGPGVVLRPLRPVVRLTLAMAHRAGDDRSLVTTFRQVIPALPSRS